MTSAIALLLVLTVITLLLFIIDKVSFDLIGLFLLVVLCLTGILKPEQAYTGFASETFMLFFGLFIMGAALQETQAVSRVAKAILYWSGSNAERVLMGVMIASCALSSVISNTATAAFFVPITFGLARKIGESPSKFLMPLAFCSILSSSVTLVSTSTNIVVSGMLTQF